MSRLQLCIAGIRIDVQWQGQDLLHAPLQERYRAFLCSDNTSCHVRVTLREETASPTHTRLDSVKVRWAEGGWRFVYDTFVADAAAALDSVEVTCVRSEFAFDTFLRALIALYLPSVRGVLLHACAVYDGEKAYVFVGRSGSGKSTIARLLSPRVQVLSDELVALRHTQNGWEAFSSPFWGEFRHAEVNLGAPVHTVYLLRQAKQHAIVTPTRREALSGLLQCSVQFAEEAQLAERMLEVVTHLVMHVPIRRLLFLPDDGFWSLITAP